jgi:hypothetical protein
MGPDQYCIYPVQARDESGELIAAQSPLGRQVHLNLSKSSVAEALGLLCKSISNKACPVNLKWSSEELALKLRNTPCASITDTKRTARTVLGEILWNYDPGLSWNMLHDPGKSEYILTIENIK